MSTERSGMSTVGTDKLAEAISDSDCIWPETPLDVGASGAKIAAWLRSPAGVAALTGDETIRRGIERDLSGYEFGKRETAQKIADVLSVDGDPAKVLADAREYARSFTEENSAPPTVVGEGPDGPIVRLTPGQAAMIKRQTWTWESSDE